MDDERKQEIEAQILMAITEGDARSVIVLLRELYDIPPMNEVEIRDAIAHLKMIVRMEPKGHLSL
jgi:hypothetical protein